MIKVIVLAGGVSAEKEISKKSGENIADALRKAGYHVSLLDTAASNFSFEQLKNADIVYPILHGTKGEDGVIQGVLEQLEIPYIGSNIMSSSVTMNKEFTKHIFRSIGISTPEGFVTDPKMDYKSTLYRINKLGYPVFIKPVSEGSSIGCLALHSEEEAQNKLAAHLKQFPICLVEKFITGREMTVGIIEINGIPKVLPILEVRPKAEFSSFETKYTEGMTEFLIPAPIPEEIREKIELDVLKIFQELQLRDCIRIDLILSENTPYYLEVNTAPGMTNTSDIPVMLKTQGISTQDFVKNIVDNALRRFSA